jgi:hypothetical protein
MTYPLKTPQVANLLGVSYWRLMAMLRSGKYPEPGKDSSGHYSWQEADVEAARRALAVDYRSAEQRGRRKEVAGAQ